MSRRITHYVQEVQTFPTLQNTYCKNISPQGNTNKREDRIRTRKSNVVNRLDEKRLQYS